MFDHDVFLSHAAADAEEADKVREALISADYRVYCDRYDDPGLDRGHVTAQTAEVLRRRMRRCKMLLFVATARSAQSKWMPWELGFFDAARGMIVVYPVDEAAKEAASNQEYLSLYQIIPPGSLRREISTRLTAAEDIPEIAKALGAWKAIQANAIDNIFGRGDYDTTKVYGQRIAQATRAPFDFEEAFRLQSDIWRAWYRLWEGMLSAGRK
jgi:hypothetical protein